ncbi:uncharacterized protein LOC132720761, partial [Ruditapes philippinarum]|uniref:uncharacterized protein LOC132720761 n=1 Tax=Ruditapes philippinarum TaxID=129788 RepID=UPI00295C1B25
MATSLDECKKAGLIEKHQTPENTTSLNTPKVNPEIWRVLSAETRSKDYASLCSQYNPVTEYLFGDNIADQ